MSIFKKRQHPGDGLSPITSFWQWWTAEGEALFTDAIDTGDYDNLPAVMSARVSAIHSDLAWEIGKAVTAEHALCVTGAGVAAIRPLAERWLRAAPPASETWEFIAARRQVDAVETSTIDFSGTQIDIGLARSAIVLDEDRESLDVRIFHPAFPTIGEDESGQIAFLLLDWLLGEDNVERWLGHIDVVIEDPDGSLPLPALRDEVVAMPERYPEPSWALFEGTYSDGSRFVGMARRPMRWIDHPLLDLHTEVQLAYKTRRADGIPDPEVLEELQQYEQALTEAIGARGMLVAHETHAGQRTLHYYTDSEDQNASDIIDRFKHSRPAKKRHHFDPAWSHMRHLG